MLTAYANSENIHPQMAVALVYTGGEIVTPTQRQRATAVNFGPLFGQGPAEWGAEVVKWFGLAATQGHKNAAR